jgi:transposase
MENEPPPARLPKAGLWSRAEVPSAPDKPSVRVKAIRRDQLVFRSVDVEQLVEPDHPARAIWELVGQRDLQLFYDQIEAVEGKAGRPPHDPCLLISLWLYSYMQGISSGREIEDRCAYHPAYQWLTGMETVCAHSLSDFRTAHAAALKDLAIQVLAVLAEEGMVDLKQVTQDGTRISASAGSDTFRRQSTLEKHLEQARQQMEKLSGEDSEALSQRSIAARQRAAREKLQRMEQALKELEAQQQDCPEDEREQVRVSLTDPDARILKHADGGFGPSYNTQFTTDARQTVIVSVEVTQAGSDAEQLKPAMERLQEQSGQSPRQAIVDGSYTSRSNIVDMDQAHIDLIGPPPDSSKQKETLYQIRGVQPEFRPEAFVWNAEGNCFTCPAGKTLPYKKKQGMTGQTKYTYQADQQDCQSCVHRGQCCPTSNSGRSLVRAEDGPEVRAFRAKMETEAAKAIYKKRGPVAEFPHLCIKERFGVRRFSVRGLKKVNTEAWWLLLTYNVQQWIRLCWKPRLPQLT